MNETNGSDKRKPSRSKLGRLTEAEYEELNRKHPPAREKPKMKLGRLTEEEYREMWNGNPPE